MTVTASDLLTAGGQLTVQPGGITVAVVLSINLGGLPGLPNAPEHWPEGLGAFRARA